MQYSSVGQKFFDHPPPSQCLHLSATIATDTSIARIYGYQVLLSIGAGAYARAGYAVIQAVVEPAMMADAMGFMMLGESSVLLCTLLDLDLYSAQQRGIALGLSVAGAVFVNLALGKLNDLFPNITSAELQSAILDVSGNSLDTLPIHVRKKALAGLVDALKSM